MKNIVFLGSKPIGFYCFKYLLENKSDLEIEIVGLITKNREEFKGEQDLTNLALKHQVPVYSDLDDLLKIEDFDILISVQYHKLLNEKHINKAKQIAINLHMAPLPEYRGSNQFSFAIINEEKFFGTTIHKIEDNVDGGPILFEDRFQINSNTITVDKLYKKTYEKSITLFKNKIYKIIQGDYSPIKQSYYQKKRKQSFHQKNEINQIKKINLKWDEEKIDRYLRATSMPGFEPPFGLIFGKKVYLLSEHLYEELMKK
jgi:methionyl-tRNA formyltransferase